MYKSGMYPNVEHATSAPPIRNICKAMSFLHRFVSMLSLPLISRCSEIPSVKSIIDGTASGAIEERVFMADIINGSYGDIESRLECLGWDQ